MVFTRSRKRKQIVGAADEDTYAEADVHSAVKEDGGTGATNPLAVVLTQLKKRRPPEGCSAQQTTDQLVQTLSKTCTSPLPQLGNPVEAEILRAYSPPFIKLALTYTSPKLGLTVKWARCGLVVTAISSGAPLKWSSSPPALSSPLSRS